MPSRRVFKERILREAQANAAALSVTTTGAALFASASPLSVVDATDQVLVLDGTVVRRATAAVARTYVLGISGGTATIPENLTVQGAATLQSTVQTTGDVSIGLTAGTARNLNIQSAAGNDRSLYWRTGSSPRWRIYATNQAESGANAGSNLWFQAFDDAGTLIDNFLTITRSAAGTVTLARPLTTTANATLAQVASGNATVTVGTGTTAGGAFLNIRAAATQYAQLAFQRGSVARWVWYLDNTTEPGSDAGGQLSLGAHTDAGAFIDNVIRINRAAGGGLSLSRPLTFANYAGVGTRALTVNASGVVGTATLATGDVVGPANATDDAVVRFDGTTGKLVQDSTVTVSDTGVVAGMTGLTVNGSGAVLLTSSNASGVSATATAGSVTLAGDGSGTVTAPTRYANVATSDNNELLWDWNAGTSTRLAIRMTAASGADAIAFGISSIDSGSFVVGPANAAGVFSGSGGYWTLLNGTEYEVLVPTTLASTLSVGGLATASVGMVVNETGVDSDTRIEGDTLTHAFLLDAGQDSLGLFTSSIPNFQTGRGIAYIANATTVPTGDPTGGGFLYVEGGALKFRGSSGTITTIALA